jgi:hypothetical protein
MFNLCYSITVQYFCGCKYCCKILLLKLALDLNERVHGLDFQKVSHCECSNVFIYFVYHKLIN